MDHPSSADHHRSAPGRRAEPPSFLPPERPPGHAPTGTADTADTAPPQPPRPRRAPWWRRGHVPYMLALVVLLPAALGLPWWLERETLLERGQMPPRAEVAEEGTAELAGSEWDFKGMVTGETGSSISDPPPDGVELVDAVFLVTPSDDDASALLQRSCHFRAVDGRGRSWEQTAEYSGRTMPEEVGMTAFGCTDAEGDPIAPGESQGLVASFLVPEDALSSLRFEVRADTSDDPESPRPAAVAFEQEE
ncbi:hypothetical protein HDA32_006029 [Spinactinospora alkalitolerans]|uniref:DUF4352 domain-containing protein n=1 Tax=Spinactinospora alkalitolerans TaxID=687207 RepID=A0A852U3Z0_9ACTN|nr:hypothetical protein [Spinactinospora alkalitolerans]NYE50909.1 hypothetical protein [Spinactinospora alkalitolerans]